MPSWPADSAAGTRSASSTAGVSDEGTEHRSAPAELRHEPVRRAQLPQCRRPVDGGETGLELLEEAGARRCEVSRYAVGDRAGGTIRAGTGALPLVGAGHRPGPRRATIAAVCGVEELPRRVDARHLD